MRIEDDAFSCERYEVLAKLCHLADSDHARGKMLRLWRQCTALHVYVLSESIVAAVLGENGASALHESGLGERVDTGVRIKGTRGRIEWLRKLRKNAKKGGIAKAAKRQAQGKQEAANNLAPPFPLTPALTTASPEDQIPPPAAKLRATKSALPDDWSPSMAESVMKAEAAARARGIDTLVELEKLRDWAKGGAAKKADWDAVWRNWLRNAKAPYTSNGKPPEPKRTMRPM